MNVLWSFIAHNCLYSTEGRKKGKTETKQAGKKKKPGKNLVLMMRRIQKSLDYNLSVHFTVANSSDDEVKGSAAAGAGGSGSTASAAVHKNKKQKVIQEKESRKKVNHLDKVHPVVVVVVLLHSLVFPYNHILVAVPYSVPVRVLGVFGR